MSWALNQRRDLFFSTGKEEGTKRKYTGLLIRVLGKAESEKMSCKQM